MQAQEKEVVTSLVKLKVTTLQLQMSEVPRSPHQSACSCCSYVHYAKTGARELSRGPPIAGDTYLRSAASTAALFWGACHGKVEDLRPAGYGYFLGGVPLLELSEQLKWDGGVVALLSSHRGVSRGTVRLSHTVPHVAYRITS